MIGILKSKRIFLKLQNVLNDTFVADILTYFSLADIWIL